MAGRKRNFTAEFRDEASREVVDNSRSIASVARGIGVSETTLGNWVRAYRERHAGEEPPLELSERARLREAEREVRELQALAAIEEIKQLKARYCYCVDHEEWDQWISLFAPDCRVDLGSWPVARHPVTNERIPVPGFSFEELEALADGAAWPAVGREALREVGSDTAANNVTVHHLFVPQIEFESESTARAIWPMEDYAWWPEGSPQRRMHGFGYYRETYQRLEDARWYIATSQFNRTWIEWRR